MRLEIKRKRKSINKGDILYRKSEDVYMIVSYLLGGYRILNLHTGTIGEVEYDSIGELLANENMLEFDVIKNHDIIIDSVV